MIFLKLVFQKGHKSQLVVEKQTKKGNKKIHEVHMLYGEKGIGDISAGFLFVDSDMVDWMKHFCTEIQSLSVYCLWMNLEYQNIMCGEAFKKLFLKYGNGHCEETEFYVVVLYKDHVSEITEDQKDTSSYVWFLK